MLVRPAKADERFEVFMLRRSEASHFVPDVYVFPGGTVDAADMSGEALARARGIEPQVLAREFRAELAPSFPAPLGFPSPAEAAGLLIAAIRELYEEAGVLLACDSHGQPLSPAMLERHGARLDAGRASTARGELRFTHLLEEIDAYANAGALALFSHWITPPAFPRRYNAHFFVAQAPADQAAAADAHETHDGIWIAPQRALERFHAGDFRMVYPTVKHVERLAQFDDADSLMSFARSKPIYSIMPDVPREREFSMPGELEFGW